MELQDKDNIYVNNIAILSMSCVDEESGRRTMQFTPPSQLANSQTHINEKKCCKKGLYNLMISALIVTCFCLILGVVITAFKNKDLNIFAASSSSLSSIAPQYDSSVLNQVNQSESIQLNDILMGRLTPSLFNGSWVSDKRIAYYDESGNLCLLKVSTFKKQILIPLRAILLNQLQGESLSKNLDYLLSPSDVSKAFRYSSLSRYKIYDIENNSISHLLPNHTGFEDEDEEYLIQYAEWGPYGTQIIFVYLNNIHYKPDVGAPSIQLTTSGIPELVYNGYADWVYEEEILSDAKAFWVSPDGKHLAYATINDTLVDVMSWNYYGDYHNYSVANQYPLTVSLRYPKPGRRNPSVQLFVINLDDVDEHIERIPLLPPKKFLNNDHYFTTVRWIDSDRVSITWLNRIQNYSTIDVCDKRQRWRCNTSFSIEANNGWVDFYDPPIVTAKHNALFIRLPQLISEESGSYYHVAMINLTDYNVKYLTSGFFDVIELFAFNEEEDNLYFLATLADKPESRHLMKVSIDSEKNLDPICLTCKFDNSCAYNAVYMSTNANYFALQCEGPDIPRVEIRRSKNNSLIAILERNEELRTKMEKMFLPTIRKFRVKTGDKYYAKVSLLLPPKFNETLRYPVVIEVYGGPGSQLVIDKFRVNHWGTYLASNKSYIYARVDVRGSSNSGVDYLNQIYHNLGNVEIEDVVTVARYFRDSVPYMDGKSMAIWGWSYGGYVTLMSLVNDHKDPALICGIAVAPVTNWMFYDSVYVERYLGLPYDNPKSYNQSDLLNKVKYLKGKKLLLAFGTADDNVHAQHSMMLMSKLNDWRINYETLVFPDNDHSLHGSTVYLYRRMSQFVDECFS